MKSCDKKSFFLPCVWDTCEKGITSFSWKDDPLKAQLILTDSEYHRCFPDTGLPWPALGEILLPEETPKTVLSTFHLEEKDHILTLSSSVENLGEEPVELPWIRLALPMDQCFRNNDVFKYEHNVLRHSGLIGRCAYAYWQKPGGKPPIYLLTAQGETEVSRFHLDSRYGQDALQATFEGLYSLELTDSPLTLKPGSRLSFSFQLAAVREISQLSQALYEMNGLASDILPGLTVERGETIRIWLDSKRIIQDVHFEDGCAEVRRTGENLLETAGAGSGEKRLEIRYSDGGISRLKFFVIDPVPEIMSGFAHHVAVNQFETDPEDPCWHGILAWNLTDGCRLNSRHNPLADWMAGGSDEIGLVSGLFLSEKNCIEPDEDEIRVLAMHAADFIEARLTEQPGYRVHRMVPWFQMFEPWAGHGADDVWRAYNYVHVVNIFCNLYRIARAHTYDFLEEPRCYLRKAWEYACAMFRYWMFPDGEGATKYGNMGEMTFPLFLLPALSNEGMADEAAQLRKLLQEKAEYLVSMEYPFGSEMSFDTTAYEAVYAYARFAGDDRACAKAVSASLANRARTPLWHKYGVDVRGKGDSSWNVSYMTQLGIWPVTDSLLEGTLSDPETAAMAHAAVLAGFSMYNSGGWWDSKPVNRHASNWVWNESMHQGNQPVPSRKNIMITGEAGLGYFGAVYAMCSYLIDHPRFGRTGLGCSAQTDNEVTRLTPRPWFDRQFCDLIHGFAIKCAHGRIREITLLENGVRVSVEQDPMDRNPAEAWIRRKKEHRWEAYQPDSLFQI